MVDHHIKRASKVNIEIIPPITKFFAPSSDNHEQDWQPYLVTVLL